MNMYQAEFEKRHKTGLERLTGGNRGILYTNERQEERIVIDGEDGETTKYVWVYDAYEIEDARSSKKAKDEAIRYAYPDGAEQRMLRKTLAAVLKLIKAYDTQDFAEFRIYNEFVEAMENKRITGTPEVQ